MIDVKLISPGTKIKTYSKENINKLFPNFFTPAYEKFINKVLTFESYNLLSSSFIVEEYDSPGSLIEIPTEFIEKIIPDEDLIPADFSFSPSPLPLFKRMKIVLKSYDEINILSLPTISPSPDLLSQQLKKNSSSSIPLLSVENIGSKILTIKDYDSEWFLSEEDLSLYPRSYIKFILKEDLNNSSVISSPPISAFTGKYENCDPDIKDLLEKGVHPEIEYTKDSKIYKGELVDYHNWGKFSYSAIIDFNGQFTYVSLDRNEFNLVGGKLSSISDSSDNPSDSTSNRDYYVWSLKDFRVGMCIFNGSSFDKIKTISNNCLHCYLSSIHENDLKIIKRITSGFEFFDLKPGMRIKVEGYYDFFVIKEEKGKKLIPSCITVSYLGKIKQIYFSEILAIIVNE